MSKAPMVAPLDLARIIYGPVEAALNRATPIAARAVPSICRSGVTAPALVSKVWPAAAPTVSPPVPIERLPPARVRRLEECVIVTSPALKLTTAPEARNRSDHWKVASPRANESLTRGFGEP